MINYDDYDTEDLSPKSKKIKGGRKGKRGELEACKIFTERFGESFIRTVGSGNRWGTVDIPQYAKETFTADLCGPNNFLFCLEIKNGYDDKIDVGNLLESSNKTLNEFLKHLSAQAKDCNKKPMLCWKRNRKPWLVFLTIKDLKPYISKFPSRMSYGNWMCVSLKHLLEILPDEFFYKI